MRKTINIDRLYFVLLLYFFLFIQSYSALIKNMIGVPVLVLVNFFSLIVIGLLIEKPNSLKKLLNVKLKYLKYLFLLIALFNFKQLLFGNYFSLFDTSHSLVFILLTPFLVFIRPKEISIVSITFMLTTTLVIIINKFPLDYSGNMLSYIDASLDMLQKGGNPYLEGFNVSGYTIPHSGYAPLLIIAYLPFKLIGMDLRYLNILFAVFFIVLYYLITKKNMNGELWQTYTLAFLSLITSPYVYLLITTKHVFFYGLLVCLLTFFTINRSHFLKSIFLALVMLTRQFAIILALPVIWGKPKRMIADVLTAASIVMIIFSPFTFQDPIKTIRNISGNRSASYYTVMPVDFESHGSPGGGTDFNIGHLIKYLYPEWSVNLNIVMIIILSLILNLLFVLRKISRISAAYFCYLVFLAFAWNFSQYFYWGIFCIPWTIAFCSHQVSENA